MLHQVAENILTKARENGTSNLRIGLLVLGGGQSGVFAANCIKVLRHLGLFTRGFDHHFGISAGAACLIYGQGGKSVKGCTIFHTDNLCGFINPLRFWRMMDLRKLEWNFRHHPEKMLDLEKLHRHPVPLHIGVTDVDSGKGQFLEVKRVCHDDPISAVIASCALPLADNRPRSLLDHRFLDGGIGLPFPLEIAELHNLTDLLVIVNQSGFDPQTPSWLEKVIAFCCLRPFSRALEQTWLRRGALFNEALTLALSGTLQNGCRVAVVRPTYDISHYSTVKKDLVAFGKKGIQAMGSFFQAV